MLKHGIGLKTDTVIDRVEQTLSSCLQEIPFLKVRKVKAEARQYGWKPGLIVKCQNGTQEKVLVVEAKENGQPKIARETVNQLLIYLKDFPKSYAIFAAPYISPQAAALCIQNGIGYLDFAGNCFLNFDRVFVKKEGNINPFSIKRDLKSLYSPKAERAIRALLSQPRHAWKIKDLSFAAEISLGQSHNVKKILLDHEWIRSSKDGFQLSNPGALLQEWAENYNFRRNEVRDFYSVKSLSEIEAEIASVCEKHKITYALTGFSGGARIASIGRYQRATAYVELQGLEKIISSLNLKEVPSGANVSLLIPYDFGVFYGKREFNGTHVVSPVQIYLDLLGFRGRGEEAANQVLDEVIKKSW